MITLKEFLEKNNACKDGFDFAKDLTLEQFLNTCQRGDWILWLFARLNPQSLRELILAKGHCANTMRELFKDERSRKAVNIAIAFGEGKATREELDASAIDAWAVVVDASDWVASCAARAAAGNADDADVVAARAADAAWTAGGNYEQNQKQTADICRKYLPLKIWNQNLI